MVLKLGGSLLSAAELLDRLMSVVRLLSPSPVLIVVGGGARADLLRDLDRRFQIPAEKSHWDAIAAMTANAAMLCRISPSLRLVGNRAEAAEVWAANYVAVLDAFAFLKEEGRGAASDALPVSWDVTSDSIALWTACRWPAATLVLAKSCEPLSTSVPELVAGRSIDPWFPHVRHECALEWLNLRNDLLRRVPLSFAKSSPQTL